MSQNLWRILLLVGSLAASLGAPCRADELGDKGRAIFRTNRQAVVIVELTLRNTVSFGGRGGRSAESRRDAAGTVIDPWGLTVLSFSSTDPATLLAAMMPGRQEDPRVKMESELAEAKMVLADGTEAPAQVVWRDKDDDLIFIRPKTKPAVPMAALDLSNPGEADILDEIIAVTRVGAAAGRAYSASVERISAVVQKPRLFYIPQASQTTTALGSPAFTLDGKCLGVFVMRSLKGKEASGMFGGLQAENVAGVILPAAQILKAAQQALAAGAAGEKKDR
jgi:hypothetical protein